MDDKNIPILDKSSLETPDVIDVPEVITNGGVNELSKKNARGQSADSQNDTLKPQSHQLKNLISKINIYFILLIVILLLLVGTTIYAINRNKKLNQQSGLSTQSLTKDSLDKLNNSDTTVGDPKQTLSVASNAIFNGAVLVKGNIDVAGTFKVGSALSLPGLTVGGTTALDTVAIKSLTVAGDTALQGKVTAQNGLSVTGNGSFSGNLTAGQLAIDSLQLNKDLQLSHHINTSGGAPGRSNGGALGGGGTASNSGTDIAGTISINTGNNAPAGCFITLSFTAAFGSVPHVIISPSSSSAAGLDYYANRTSNGFSVCTASDPPDNTAGIAFDYIVVN